jgi:CRISPR-associated exonuclease Cas4
MEAYLQITYLNDFVFCPYSVYLHQVFDNNVQELYSASPQQRGKSAHLDIDSFEKPELPHLLSGIYVISNKFRVYGKLDKFYVKEKKLVESKYEIKTLYRGYYYQIWAQYFALLEMGFDVEQLYFYEIKTKKYYQIPIPGVKEADELINHIRKIARFDFEAPININPAKCKHCIYASLCDKTQIDHVYA